MKKYFVLILSLLLVLMGISACADTGQDNNNNNNNGGMRPPVAAADNVLIAYFSCTGTTEGVAETIAGETGGVLHEIVPSRPYTEADLDYTVSDCRANEEQRTPSARPEIANSVENMADYDIIFLGYPIWQGRAPKIIYTFLERYDFSGKTIVPFCTSGSTGIGGSEGDLHALAEDAEWSEGRRFPAGATAQTVRQWLDALQLFGSASA